MATLAGKPAIDLELLALKLSTGVVADSISYTRVVRDVARIRELDPALGTIGYFPPHDGRDLFLSVDAATLAAMRAGRYHAWDCLNQSYVLDDVTLSEPKGTPYAVIRLKGIYELERLSKEYAALPGVASADPNLSGGDGPTICLTAEGELWHYVFDDASGDCPAGCTEHVFYHFTSSPEGVVSALGELTPELARKYASLEACR